jgi:uncharacterized protein (UPF0332 family)
VKPHDFIATARILLSSSKGKPTVVSLQRATSTAYYALFHCLAQCCADLLIGTAGATRSMEAWQQVYRPLDHGYTKGQCKNKNVMQRFPAGIQDFANCFLALQEKRHSADYDPLAKFAKSTVEADIDQAEQAIKSFSAVPAADRRAFCAYVLLRDRRN